MKDGNEKNNYRPEKKTKSQNDEIQEYSTENLSR